MKKFLLLLALLAGGYFYWQSFTAPNTPFGAPAGAYLDTEPAQNLSLRLPFKQAGYTVFTLASYEMDARVLGICPYDGGEASDIVPFDLALGWGPMADQAKLSGITVTQSDRRYFWQASKLPMPAEEISRHSANTHIIPASPEVKAAVAAFKPGQLVSLRGRLVSLSGPGGWSWTSSVTRNDTGDGACELFYVESAALISAHPAKAPAAPVPAQSRPPVAARAPSPVTPPRPAAAAISAVRLTVPLSVSLKYGVLTIPAGETVQILEERAGRCRSTFRAHEFWVEKAALR